jgi:hypothetical protein
MADSGCVVAGTRLGPNSLGLHALVVVCCRPPGCAESCSIARTWINSWKPIRKRLGSQPVPPGVLRTLAPAMGQRGNRREGENDPIRLL